MNDKVRALEALRDKFRAQYKVLDPDRIEIGDFTYGCPLIMTWGENTKLRIGKFCSIGANVQIYMGGNHHTDRLTTYPFDVLLDGETTPSKGDVIIGNDVWIGQNAVILPGLHIGDGAIIGANAVVGSNVEPYTIVVGNPAQFIRNRFDEELTALLLQWKWWDKPVEEINSLIPILTNPDLNFVKAKIKQYLANS
jgi:virginiamycin A acetyltransferase